MSSLLPAGIAEFFCFHPLGMLFLVLGRGVVAVLTISALQCNDLAHDFKTFQCNRKTLYDPAWYNPCESMVFAKNEP
jgi:hypothetical protein